MAGFRSLGQRQRGPGREPPVLDRVQPAGRLFGLDLEGRVVVGAGLGPLEVPAAQVVGVHVHVAVSAACSSHRSRSGATTVVPPGV